MDRSTALNLITAAGVAYSGLTIFAPKYYVGQNNIDVNDDTVHLARSAGCGIAGLTSVAYMARDSDNDTQRVALCSLATAFSGWTAFNALRCMSKDSLQAKVDLATAGVLLGVTTAALMNN